MAEHNEKNEDLRRRPEKETQLKTAAQKKMEKTMKDYEDLKRENERLKEENEKLKEKKSKLKRKCKKEKSKRKMLHKFLAQAMMQSISESESD